MQTQHIEFLQLLNGDVQYVVPRWQRRYCWRQSDIERLVEDLLAIADANEESTHYAGTLLTFPEPGPAGVLTTIRIVDGQQRLTTVSILLACIAAKLEREGSCGEWTHGIIRERRLTNPHMGMEKRHKLRLQGGDEIEYRSGLDGNPKGSGAVAQAWRIARRLVERNHSARLLAGLERLRVVSIGLDAKDDPQQIFESLNATGRPLTESEKVKNWLLIGLPEDEQRELHDRYWCGIEQILGAKHSSEPIDLFIRDVMRWRTGEVLGSKLTYEQLRRWALKHGHDQDRPALCRELARLARLYGYIAGAASFPDRKVEAELKHLRELGFDVHRPFSLRLLDDASQDCPVLATHEDLAKTISGIGSWVTRLWLADRPTAGLHKVMAELAFSSGPDAGENYSEFWLSRVRRLRNRRIGVPSDEDVREGIRTRKAYGSSATKSTFAVLCQLMEAEHPSESPARSRLTVEHVMPQKLTDEWKLYLGEGAEAFHSKSRDRLANLTLSGDVSNSSMGATSFAEKQDVYRNSTIGITRRLADEDCWNEEVLSRRTEDLADQVLARWPWPDDEIQSVESRVTAGAFRWRIEDGPWHDEISASHLILNVTGALLSMDSANAQKLSGGAISGNVHSAMRYPANELAGSQIMRAVPDHPEFVIYPYGMDYPRSAERCRKMGERCGIRVEVVVVSDGADVSEAFWRFLDDQYGGIPGQRRTWRGFNQLTSPVNARGDMVGVQMYTSSPERLALYIRSGEWKKSDSRTRRMHRFSWSIREQLADQKLGVGLEAEAARGRSITVELEWERKDDTVWHEAAQWMLDQLQRLQIIANELPSDEN